MSAKKFVVHVNAGAIHPERKAIQHSSVNMGGIREEETSYNYLHPCTTPTPDQRITRILQHKLHRTA